MGKGARKDEKPSAAKPSSGGAGARGKGPRTQSWLKTHGRDLKFLLIFALLMVGYFFAETTKPIHERFFPWYLTRTAEVSGGTLRAFGYKDVEVVDKSLVGSRGSITVERGCDAIAPTALFLSAVIASPTPWLPKFPALIGGTLILMIVNVFRIITLFLTRIYWPKAFDVMHLDIWQAAFIFLAIFLWAGWASWVAKRNKRQAHAAT